MVYDTGQCCHASSPAIKDGWRTSIVSWLSREHENNIRKTRLKKLLSYDDHTLEDVGLSRPKVIQELGYDPREAQHIYSVFTYPNPYLSTGSVIIKNH